MDVVSLKKYIYINEKIQFVLDSIGCHHIKYHVNKNFYSCANYNGDNTSAVNVKNNPYLNVDNWTRQQEFDKNSDIISLIQYNKNCSFLEAVKYLHRILGLKYTQFDVKSKKAKSDPLDIFKKAQSKKRLYVTDVSEIQFLNDKLTNEYIPLLHISWFKEGITERTREKFGLAYSYKNKRIVIPMRYWLSGELLGVNMRTTIENYDVLGIKKYFITPSYPKSLNLFGLYENYNFIKSTGYVVVYESEKSVLKRDSLCDSTGVALSGKTISDEQQQILIGLNSEIVIALDNDVDINEIRFMCEKFYRIRPVSYILDKWGLLNEKDSPADAKNKIFNFLFDNRIQYNAEEHRAYLKSVNKDG